MTQVSPLLELDCISLSFPRGRTRLRAVDHVSLALRPGEVFGLAGESGSGKSTLARIAVALLRPEQGAVRFRGMDLAQADRRGLHDFRRRVQIVFQDPATALSPRRTVAQILREPLAHFRIAPRSEWKDRATAVLGEVGLDAAALDRYPREFSSGQRQRIAIARALLCEPELLIADEAVSALDLSVQAQVLDLLRGLQGRHRLAMLFISHDLAVIRQLAHRVGVMFRGRLVECGPAESLFASPAHPYTRELIAAAPRLGRSPASAAPPGLASVGRAVPAEGCAFRERCPEALPACARVVPASTLLPRAQGHRVECHLHESALTQEPDRDR